MNKRLKYFLISFLVILVYPKTIYAVSCNQEQINKINSLINNIKFEFVYDYDNYYKLNIYNIPQEITVDDLSRQISFSYNENNISQSNDYIGGETYKFKFNTTDNINCKPDINFTKSIYVNKYNKYSESEICQNENNKDFKLCNKDYQGNITDEIFNNEYKKYLKIKQKEDNIVEEQDVYVSFYDEYKNYIFIGSGILVIMFIFLVIKITKKKRSNF